MEFRFACSDFTFPLLAHKKSLPLIALLGFDGVDIGLFEERSEIQPSMVFNDPEKNGKLLKKMTDDNGLKVADVFYQGALDFTVKAINHPDEKIRKIERENFLKTLEYAVAAQSYHVTCLPGVHYEGETVTDSLLRVSEELAWRVEEAKKMDISFGVEPHIGSIISTPEQTLALLQMTDGLRLTLDYTHFMRQNIPNERVHPLIPYASHFHARGAASGKLQTSVAENEIDYGLIVEKMKEVGYEGYIGIEYIWMEWENCNRTDNVSESILLMELLKERRREDRHA